MAWDRPPIIASGRPGSKPQPGDAQRIRWLITPREIAYRRNIRRLQNNPRCFTVRYQI